MIIVGKVIVAEPILERKFSCQLNACKGACCVQGDSGAPLLEEELEIITNELPNIKPFMSAEGLELLENKGFYETDSDGDLGTVCRPSGECIFVNMEDGVAICTIEKAYYAKATWFKKPISCHLYPIRAKQYGDYIALNYHHWDICSPACKAGEEMKLPVYTFLHDALVRKFGPSWYRELEEVAEAWGKR